LPLSITAHTTLPVPQTLRAFDSDANKDVPCADAETGREEIANPAKAAETANILKLTERLLTLVGSS
jgi:hypothetical protein